MSSLAIIAGSQTVLVPTATVAYQRWPGPKLTWRETYGKTQLVGQDGGRTCAEVAIVEALRAAGWDAWWIDSFGQAPTSWRSSIAVVDGLPAPVRDRFATVEAGAGSPKPTRWDIVAWKGPDIVILESKGSGDTIRPGQAAWLARALETGAFVAADFGVVSYVARP
jgi:hypothetical protein